LALAAWWSVDNDDQNPVEYRDTSGSDTAYAELIMHLWRTSPDGFTIVEQDVAFLPEALPTLIECERDYCCFPYVWSTQIGPALGMTSFKPGVLAEIVGVPNLHGVHYRQVDIFLMRHILGRTHGRQPHIHLPPVKHLNPDQQLRPEFEHLTLAEHLAALGYEISEDGKTAEYMHATAEFGDIGVRA
jgi:hypothetical protein